MNVSSFECVCSLIAPQLSLYVDSSTFWCLLATSRALRSVFESVARFKVAIPSSAQRSDIIQRLGLLKCKSMTLQLVTPKTIKLLLESCVDCPWRHVSLDLFDFNCWHRDLATDRHVRLLVKFQELESLELSALTEYQVKQLNPSLQLNKLVHLKVLKLKNAEIRTFQVLKGLRIKNLVHLTATSWSTGFDFHVLETFYPLMSLEVGLVDLLNAYQPPPLTHQNNQEISKKRLVDSLLQLKHFKIGLLEYTLPTTHLSPLLGDLLELKSFQVKVFGSKEIRGLEYLDFKFPPLPCLRSLTIEFFSDYHPAYHLGQFYHLEALEELILIGQFSSHNLAEFLPLFQKRLVRLELRQTSKETPIHIYTSHVEEIQQLTLVGNFNLIES